MDERTAKNIEVRVEKILRDMGVKKPPLNLEDVLDFLEVYREYYDLMDPGLLQEISHKLKIGVCVDISYHPENLMLVFLKSHPVMS